MNYNEMMNMFDALMSVTWSIVILSLGALIWGMMRS